MELQGKSNPDLVKSMHGLAGGIGFNGLLCGALTGGACLLGLYAGKGTAEEVQDDSLDLMLGELVYWFKGKFGEKGLNCDDILEGSQSNIPLRCPAMVAAVFQKSKEILVENGFDLSGNIDGD
ncbi:MAG: DVU_1555 family C-GCAxxG-C-C protein [Anaerolineaceae bacterium]